MRSQCRSKYAEGNEKICTPIERSQPELKPDLQSYLGTGFLEAFCAEKR